MSDRTEDFQGHSDYTEKDVDFLKWIWMRLTNVKGDRPNDTFMVRLGNMIDDMESGDKEIPVGLTVRGLDSYFRFSVVSSISDEEGKVYKVLCEGFKSHDWALKGFWDRVMKAGQKYPNSTIELVNGDGTVLQAVEVTT